MAGGECELTHTPVIPLVVFSSLFKGHKQFTNLHKRLESANQSIFLSFFLMQTFLRLLLQPHWVCFVRVYHQHRLEACLLFRRNILGAKGGLWYGGGCGGARPTVHSTNSNERFK